MEKPQKFNLTKAFAQTIYLSTMKNDATEAFRRIYIVIHKPYDKVILLIYFLSHSFPEALPCPCALNQQ